MRILYAIVLLGLLSSSFAFINVKKIPSTVIDTSFLKHAHSEKKLTFSKLTSFMQQQLRDTSQITEFLHDLLEQVAENRKEKLAIIEQTREQCSDEQSFRTQAITEGQRAASASQTQLNLCTSQKEQSQHLKDLASSALEVYQADLEDLEDARSNQKKTFADRSQKLQALLDSLQELQNYLDEYEAESLGAAPGALFIQTTNKLLKHSVATGHSHLLLPVYTQLLQMHARQDYNSDDVAEIRQLLAKLGDLAGQALQAVNDDEAKDEQAYQNSKEIFDAVIARLSNQVTVTDQFSASMDQCIGQENSVLALSNDKVQRNTDLLDVSTQLCDAGEEQWRLSELSRTKEVNIINALLGAVNRFEADFEEEEGPKVEDLIGNSQ